MSVRTRRNLLIALWVAYGLLWICATGGHILFGGTPPEIAWPAPVFLALTATVLFLSAPDDWRTFVFTGAGGFIVEVIGVHTRIPFGSYFYTNVLGPAIFGVPVVMAFAWIALLAWVRQLKVHFLIGAAAMTACDLALDPVTSRQLDFWHWRSGSSYYGVPLSNFAGWFLVSAFFLYLIPRSPRNPGVFAMGCSIILFFALIGLAHGFFVPTSIASLLCGAGYWRWRSSSVSTRI